MTLTDLQNLAAWVVLVLAVAFSLGGIWVLVDSMIGNFQARVRTPEPRLDQPRVYAPPSFQHPAAKGFRHSSRRSLDAAMRAGSQPKDAA